MTFHSKPLKPMPCWSFLPHDKQVPTVDIWLGTDIEDVIPCDNHFDILITAVRLSLEEAQRLIAESLKLTSVIIKGRLK